MFFLGLFLAVSLAFAGPSTRIGVSVEFPKSGGPIKYSAQDSQGNLYILGQSLKGGFPLVNPLQPTGGSGNCSIRPQTFSAPCGDLFLAKFDPTGKRILFSTYLGTDGPDTAAGLAIDAENNIWVAFTYAATSSYLSLPTSGRLRVLKLPSDGSRILAQYDNGDIVTGAGLVTGKQGQIFIAGTKVGNTFTTVRPLLPAPSPAPLLVTRDGGATWSRLGIGLDATVVCSLAIDPNSQTLFAATNNGLFRSVNSGARWGRILPSAQTVWKVVLTSGGVLYASHGNNAGAYLLVRSTDGGNNWSDVASNLPRHPLFNTPQQIGSFAVDPIDSNRIWILSNSLPEGAVFFTPDGGRNWTDTRIPNGTRFSQPDYNALLIDPTDPQRVVACCLSQADSGLLTSQNGGASWTNTIAPDAGFGGLKTPLLDPLDRNSIYAPWDSGPYRSPDFGRTWTSVPLPTTAPKYGYGTGSLFIHPRTSEFFLIHGDGILLRSLDRGKVWTMSRGPWGPEARILALDPARPDSTIYVGSYSPENATATTNDGFLLQLDSSAQVLSATLIGGSQTDSIDAISIDTEGNLILAGSTNSTDFPTRNAAQATKSGLSDAFIMVLAPQTGTLVSSTYWGGPLQDRIVSVGTDREGDVYITGSTYSGFPTSPGAFKTQLALNSDSAFAAKFEKGTGRNLYSTYIGGSYGQQVNAISVDPSGAAWILGQSSSVDYPIVDAIQPSLSSISPTLLRLAAKGDKLEYSTFLPTGLYTGLMPSQSASGASIWLHGLPTSYNDSPFYTPIPTTNDPPVSAFLSRLDIGVSRTLPPGQPVVDAVFQGGSFQWSRAVSWGGVATLQGAELAPRAAAYSTTNLPTSLEGVSVTIGGIPAPLYYVSPTQINLQIPFDLPLGPAPLVVTREGIASEAYIVNIDERTPGIFTLDGSGAGAPLIVHSTDFSLVTVANPARIGEILSLFLTGLGRTTSSPISGAPNPLSPSSLVGSNYNTDLIIDSSLQTPLYIGAAPGYIGLYQVNFTVPAFFQPGLHSLQVGGSNQVLFSTK